MTTRQYTASAPEKQVRSVESPPELVPDQLSSLEIAAGTVLGRRTDLAKLDSYDLGTTPRAAIETVIRAGLMKNPCVVSFSGGRDSSAVLAIAADVARREGLPLPIPVTLRFPECETSLETEWQELVINHLALPDWQRIEFSDELDLVGPVAAESLREHGLLWPFNAYFHVPIASVAQGGSVLTGVGGDELFSSGWAWHRLNMLLGGHSRPRPLDLARVVIAVGPAPLKRNFLALQWHGRDHATPWLRPEAREEILRRRLSTSSRESLSFSRSVQQFWWPLRSRFVGAAALDALAADVHAHVVSPLAAPEFLAAITRDRGWQMFETRTQAMTWFVGDLLPPELISRPTKAWFDGAFWNRHAREFASTWDGSGVDADIVDVDALRSIWSVGPDDTPDARTYTLLQSAWLAAERGP